MKNQIKELVLSQINSIQDKTVQDISTYSLVRPGNGLYYLKIYWRGKAKKGGTASILVDLTYQEEAAIEGIKAINEIMEEAKAITFNTNQPVKTMQEKGEW